MADSYDLSALLSTEDRDFLIRNNGDQVKINDLNGKTVGLYFSAPWSSRCREFTPILIETYKELSEKGYFEIVFVSSDRDEEFFQYYFSKMPWLAVPISDKDTRKSLQENFSSMVIPHLVILDKDGKISTSEGVEMVMDYEAEAYPFTPERINQLQEEEEAAKRNQTLKTLLENGSRDYVISSDERKVSVSELEGKMVGLYFYIGSYKPCTDFTKKLAKVHKELQEKGENFEIVLIYLDLDYDEEEEFKEVLAQLSCFALPYKDKKIEKLSCYFEVESIPSLVLIGPDGNTLNPNVTKLIDKHGAEAYPFTPERLAEIEKAKLLSQTLESILVSGEKDYVIDKSGSNVPVSQLVGKYVLIYFSAHWCPPCRAFTPQLIKVYHEIKAKENAFEIIFVSSDRGQSSFDKYYADMPWLALPFGDERKTFMSRKFKVHGLPRLVAIGPEGRTITTEARHLVGAYGADAFPFTEEHIKNLKEKIETKEGYVCEGNACRKT